MQIRHRIPTIFNLSMVDVLCCALGCVILLWLLNLREAKERALAAGETGTRLQAVQSDLDETISMLLNVARERDDVARQAEAAAQERDRARREWETARSRLAVLEKDLAALKNQQATTEDRLTKLTREKEMLVKEKADAAERLIQLDSLLSAREASAKTTARRLEELTEQLRTAESRGKKLQAEIQGYRGMFSATESRLRTLEQDARLRTNDLAAAQRRIDLLQQEKKSLADQASRARTALENRFEGIMLTGRRVVFLVDMSGSMDYVEERTPDPEKWKGVRQTLAKVMRSLNDLEKFQVILFANKISYLLGEDGRWLDYDPKASVDRVVQALAAIKPRGSTNMYSAFEAAFRFRSQGLDTIYVLSDGLPNDGPGLPDNRTDFTETQRSDLLAKHIRKLLRGDWNRALAGRSRVRINTIGFFYESPDVGAFLWALARENDGSFVGMSKP
jgi:hypothetical protein